MTNAIEWKRAKGQGKPVYTLTAPSFEVFSEYAEGVTSDEQSAARGASSTDPDRSRDWDYGIGFAGAVEHGKGRAIWSEGKEALEQAAGKARAIAREQAPAICYAYAEAGFSPNAARFAAGDLRCMRRPKAGAARSRPSVAILLDTTAPAWVKAADLTRMTAASLALAAILSRRGYRVRAYTAPIINADNDKPVLFAALAPLFSPAKPYSAARCAFQACHPASLRRLGFAALERLGERGNGTCGRGYGTCHRNKPERLAEAIRNELGVKTLVTLPAGLDDDADAAAGWSAAEEGMTEAVAFVLSEARRQGIDI